MKFKKGFSLAEIVIAVLIIGIIATLTIPNSMKSMDRRHKITAYNIAFAGVATSVDTIRHEGDDRICDQDGSNKWQQEKCIHRVFRVINKDTNAEGYICGNNANDNLYQLNTSYKLSNIKYKTNWTSNENSKIKTKVGQGSDYCDKKGGSSPWILTKSGIVYSVYINESIQRTCGTILEINSAGSDDEAFKKACGVVVIDYNGLHKGPNTFPKDSIGGNIQTAITDDEFEDILDSADRFFIYIGNDGITAGSPTATISGRLKNQGSK